MTTKEDTKILRQAQAYIPAEVLLISGCRDEQESADVSNVALFGLPDPAGRAGGACTSALLKTLYACRDDDNTSYGTVLARMRAVLEERRMTQIPQLSSSRPMDVHSTTFELVPPNKFNTVSGTKRAVLIGINYKGMRGELTGCHNDINNMKTYIQEVHGFQEENITMIMDEENHIQPTRDNILNTFAELVQKSQPGDAVFCHYAGHGGSVPDKNGDEEDGFDETLIPIDYKKSGQIIDDDLFKVLICPMPKGVFMTCLVDCCHSGTILDLPFAYKQDGTQQQMQLDSHFKFPHNPNITVDDDNDTNEVKDKDDEEDAIKQWHWSIYALAMVPVAIAVAIPIVLWLLPSGPPPPPPPPPPPAPRRGPLRMLGNLFRMR